jgi:cytochrome c oxidase cbb3-type subunit 4
MDINTLRNLMTLLAFGAFLGIIWWAYSPSRRDRFEQDARLVFDESEGETK